MGRVPWIYRSVWVVEIGACHGTIDKAAVVDGAVVVAIVVVRFVGQTHV